MGRALTFSYGIAVYGIFFGAFLYSIGFVGSLIVPKSINSGPEDTLLFSLAVNIALLSIFALQHSVMARPGFKRVWTQIIPQSIERSTYILLTSGALCLIFVGWQPITHVIWDVSGTSLGLGLQVTFWTGWLIVLTATFMIDHFELFGLKQVFSHLTKREFEQSGFQKRFLYRLVRHPIMTGFLIAFWATPTMTAGHLLFACVTIAYIYIAVTHFEEKDLVDQIGDDYKNYQKDVGSFIPGIGRKRK
ncbi:methanethiol S-methyltransferase [Sneathiella aquimaris]|uniref:methanethiol S-methyltransferase n=1 Tax=Sneathiella aquimaris TaxID=2599305 RepID=UPI001469CEA7|nr:methanethiol S-methyltransferase [Sneathiella aquimaris]